jgi:hypothetical protein
VAGVTAELPEHRKQLIWIRIEFRLPMPCECPDPVVGHAVADSKPEVLSSTIKIRNQMVHFQGPSRKWHPIAALQVDFIEWGATARPSARTAPDDSVTN